MTTLRPILQIEGRFHPDDIPVRHTTRMDRSQYPTALRKLGEVEHDPPVAASASERIAMMWELTLQAFEFKEGRPVEPRLRRDVVRVVRGGR